MDIRIFYTIILEYQDNFYYHYYHLISPLPLVTVNYEITVTRICFVNQFYIIFVILELNFKDETSFQNYYFD